MITVDVATITGLLVGGDWWNVNTVSVDFLEYTAGPATHRWAHGLYVRATIQGGPHNGDKLTIPLARIDGVRT